MSSPRGDDAHSSQRIDTDVDLTIRDERGATVLAIEAGPLLLARIPAARYTVTANDHGQIKERTVVSDHKPEHIVFAW